MLAFGDFELQPERRRLLQRGEPVALGTRAFDVLLVLAEHRDQLVTKSELLDRVWAGLVVEENNLQVQISSLRKLLGPQAIATFPAAATASRQRSTAPLRQPLPSRPPRQPIRRRRLAPRRCRQRPMPQRRAKARCRPASATCPPSCLRSTAGPPTCRRCGRCSTSIAWSPSSAPAASARPRSRRRWHMSCVTPSTTASGSSSSRQLADSSLVVGTVAGVLHIHGRRREAARDPGPVDRNEPDADRARQLRASARRCRRVGRDAAARRARAAPAGDQPGAAARRAGAALSPRRACRTRGRERRERAPGRRRRALRGTSPGGTAELHDQRAERRGGHRHLPPARRHRLWPSSWPQHACRCSAWKACAAASTSAFAS